MVLSGEMVVFVAIVALCFLFAVYGSVFEAVAERDWPREMFKFVLWFGLPILLVLAACGY